MIFGIFTTKGIDQSIDSANNEGFFVFPTSFGVSDVAGDLLKSREFPTAGEFYVAPISGRVKVDSNSVKIICTIPQGQTAGIKDIKEIVLYAENSLNETFLLALGQPSEDLVYNPDGTVTLEVQIALLDVDVEGNYVFNNTQATELLEHNTDPTAHIEIIEAISKAGILIPMGAYPQEHRGQSYQQNVEFDGTKAVALSGGINFSSKYNGTEGNSISLTFDNVLTVDEVMVIWNNANPNNMVTHDGVGTEVLPVQTVNLAGGTYLVSNKDNVYKDDDGIYKVAIADGTKKTNAVASARIAERMAVFGTGLLDITTGFAVGDKLYLSSTVAGAFSNINNGVSLGIVLEAGLILYTGFNASADIESSQTFEAVVTDVTGLGLFSSSQNAIDAIPSGSRILIDKLEFLKATIDTQGKILDFVFNGVDKGWTKFLGQVASFKMEFDAVPDAGTFRMEWKGQESDDLLYNASALDIETEFNLFSGHTGVVVTGSFAIGFTFTFADEFPQPVPTFIYAGHNEKQRFEFGNIPDDGTIQFAHDANNTLNFPWDDLASDLKLALEALPSIDDVTITGNFADQFFEIEFNGGVLVDGLQPRNEISVVMSDLDQTGTPTNVNGIDPSNPINLPIDPITIIQGKYPASNLRTAGGANTDVIITVTELSSGEPVGPDTAIKLDAPNIAITGYGLVQNFENGIDVNGQDQAVISMRFDNVINPILAGKLKAGVDIDYSNTLGYAKDMFAQLKLSQDPNNPKRVLISGADEILASGVKLSQELASLLLKFAGASIDFSTGEIFEEDGVTPLGIDFTPFIPSAEKFIWASITIIPESVNADGSMKGQVLVLFGETEDDSPELASKAPFADGKPLGQIVLEGDLGEEEITLFITTRDQFSDLDTKHIIIYDDLGSVAVWIDVDNNGSIEPAHGADRSIKVIGVVENGDPNNVAIAFDAVINADPKFTSVRANNRITVTSLGIGERLDATEGTTAFNVSIVQQGRSTDVTGLVDIQNSSIRQLGTGAGGGGGAGDASTLLGRMEDLLDESFYQFLEPNVFSLDAETKVGSTDASYSVVDKTFNFTVGQILQSVELLDPEFLTELDDLLQVMVALVFESGSEDVAPLLEMSNNGVDFEAVTLERLSSTNDTYIGNLVFDLALLILQNLHEVAGEDSQTVLEDVGTIDDSQDFTTSQVEVAEKITVSITKTGSPVGYAKINFHEDDAGSVGIVKHQSLINIEDLIAGQQGVAVEIGRHVLADATKYHISIETDQVYKDSFDTGVDEIAVGQNSTVPSMVYKVEGRALSLLLKYTASADSKLAGYGVYYGDEAEGVQRLKRRASFVFDAQSNLQNEFQLPWNADPDFIELQDRITGQVWGTPTFALQNNKIVFPVDFFEGREIVYLVAKQVEAGSFDGNPELKKIIVENHLGSNDPSLDYSVPGRGPIASTETTAIKVELTVDENMNLVIKEA